MAHVLAARQSRPRVPAPVDLSVKRAGIWINDVHSQLNRTRLSAIVRPESIADLRRAVLEARTAALPVSVCGGRHAMGGQQFCAGGVLTPLR